MAETIAPEFFGFLKLKQPSIQNKSAEAVLSLTGEGATVPFIARYRKEKTGNLDEVEVRAVIDLHETFVEITKRREFILAEIGKQGNLTDELKSQIVRSTDLNELEELYRPFKKKKKTKARIAMDAGIGPLADWILGLGAGTVADSASLEVKAKEFINPAATFATYEEVLRGAQHIIVEKLSNNPELRALVKQEYFTNGKIVSTKTKDYKPNSKYSMYAEFQEPAKTIQLRKSSHRYLALRRGWHEGELKVGIEADDGSLLKHFESEIIKKSSTQADEFLRESAKIALTVHVVPSVTNELHAFIKERADLDAITVFAENVRRVLMSSPFGAKVVLGVDPGLRTGAKIALVDANGRFVTSTVMHMQSDDSQAKAKKLISDTLSQLHIDAIAVGNGTAGRETESFLRKLVKEIGKEVPVILVNESGASVYSASDVAREEFPELDLTIRGAISIARRLQDPLSELVKIEPKSIGVGQYQHDVEQNQLKKSLHAVVESCVNQVGVDVNTASISLLQYVAGIGPAIAKNIVKFRSENGLFQDRTELSKVPHLSTRVFEQSAGFLRVRDGRFALDQTGIHPERYQAVRDMVNEAGLQIGQVLGGNAEQLLKLREKWVQLIGEYTFDDIINELKKPGRDPRDPYKVFSFREDIHEVKDLKEGMICPGIVTNVTNFGAFVDIGVHQDGLVHISQLTHDFVEDPRLVVNPGDQVMVKVLTVDLEKTQIALTMKLEERPMRAQPARPQDRRPRDNDSSSQNRGDGARGNRRPGGERRDQDGQRGPGAAPRAAGGRPSSGDRSRGGDRDNRDQQRRDNREQSRDHGPRQDHGGRPPRAGGGSPFNNPFAGLTLKK
jgi:uncharacterized protein